jgi:hypothetical protein
MSGGPGRTLLCCALLLAGAAPAAEVSHDVTFDSNVDFHSLHTFTIGAGRTSSRFFEPEIDNRLFLQRMRSSIRAALAGHGMQEASGQPDIAVSFSVVIADYASVERREPMRVPDTATQRGFVIPGGPEPLLFTAGTLVIDLTDASGKLLWRGTWHERQRSGPKLSSKLSDDARALLQEFPPRRKQGLIQ